MIAWLGYRHTVPLTQVMNGNGFPEDVFKHWRDYRVRLDRYSSFWLLCGVIKIQLIQYLA